MKLRDLLAGLSYRFMEDMDCPDFEQEVTALCFDNRKPVPKGAAFVCIKGTKYDTHEFADDAKKQGACCIIAEREVKISCDGEIKNMQSVDGENKAEKEQEGSLPPCVILVNDTRRALSILAANWFSNPARSMITIGITGTKGKSTTAGMIRSILEEDGQKTGIIGTIGVGIGDRYLHTDNTTPGPYELQQYLRMMVDEGCRCMVMEVSSQALKQSRTAAIRFDYGIFTNIEPDHIGENEHRDFEEYMHCKSLLFKQCRHGSGNIDDAHFSDVTGASCCGIESFGILKGEEVSQKDTKNGGSLKLPDIYAANIHFTDSKGDLGIEYDACGAWEGHVELSIPGRFNIYNSLAAISVCRHIVKESESIKRGLKKTKVKGRLEPVRISNSFSLMIDYAHNAMALESLLKTLREYHPKRLVCLFGCGGNRDRERRYEMGEVSSKLADLTVVTSDNPRFEEPLDIIDDILRGVRKASGWHVVIPDRREAIRYCIENAREGDMIVLAGKGQEDYQEIKGVKYPMDERDIIAQITGEKPDVC